MAIDLSKAFDYMPHIGSKGTYYGLYEKPPTIGGC